MNSGHRGGAYGFEIDSINRTCDTKSSIDKNITFLHYLALIVEKKVSCYFWSPSEIWIAKPIGLYKWSVFLYETGFCTVKIIFRYMHLLYCR